MNEEQTQTCIGCRETLSLSEFNKNPHTANGYSGKCKACTKQYNKDRASRRKLDPVIREQDNAKKRARRRLRGRHDSRSTEQRLKDAETQAAKFPEKREANRACAPLRAGNDTHNHHWSYNEEHLFDVIVLPRERHYLVHRFMTYDRGRMMYRKPDGTLIDSREAAIAYYATLKDDTPETLPPRSPSWCGKTHTPESRAKMSAIRSGRKLSPEHVAHVRVALLGRTFSPETIEKMRVAAVGRRFSPETIEKIRISNIGRKQSSETRAKRSASLLGRTFSPESRAKMSAAKRGRKLSPEHCAKLREARQAFIAKKNQQSNPVETAIY